MIKYINLFSFLIITLLVEPTLHSKESKIPEYEKYVNEIVDDFVKDMEKKYKLHCYGSGGSMPTDVEKIDVLFISYQKSTVDDARRMEVSVIQELLQRINSHEKIKPYLREYPFHANRVGISIAFQTETDDYPLDGSIARVSTGRDKIFYYTAEMKMSDPIPFSRMNKNELIKETIPGSLQEKLVALMDEPYEEALQIVQTSNAKR